MCSDSDILFLVAPEPINARHEEFLTHILPTAKTHAEHAFRCLDHDRKADAVQETIGLCWKWYVRLLERGKDPLEFPSKIALFASRAVWNGRRLAGETRSKEVLSPSVRKRGGFQLSHLGSYDDALIENDVTPVPEQVAFRIDFRDWLQTLPDPKDKIVRTLSVGASTKEAAEIHDVSAGRISQIRREAERDWQAFQNV